MRRYLAYPDVYEDFYQELLSVLYDDLELTIEQISRILSSSQMISDINAGNAFAASLPIRITIGKLAKEFPDIIFQMDKIANINVRERGSDMAWCGKILGDVIGGYDVSLKERLAACPLDTMAKRGRVLHNDSDANAILWLFGLEQESHVIGTNEGIIIRNKQHQQALCQLLGIDWHSDISLIVSGFEHFGILIAELLEFDEDETLEIVRLPQQLLEMPLSFTDDNPHAEGDLCLAYTAEPFSFVGLLGQVRKAAWAYHRTNALPVIYVIHSDCDATASRTMPATFEQYDRDACMAAVKWLTTALYGSSKILWEKRWNLLPAECELP